MNPTRITKRELDEMLGVEFEYDAKAAILKMTRDEQTMAIFSAQAYLRGQIAQVKKWQIEYEGDCRSYRNTRERIEREHNGDSPDLENITEKIVETVQKALAQRFDFWIYLRDRVFPTMLSTLFLMLIVLMGLFVSGKLP